MTGAAIEARMLGGFCLSYDGRPVDMPGAAGSQFASLMQLVLHYPEGVARNDLLDALFGTRRSSVEDAAHAVRSVVYNANRRLENNGIPGRPCIVQKKGMCMWSGVVPIRNDAREFEALASAALSSGDADRLEAACLAYSGGFLDGCPKAVWAVSEDRRYRAMFSSCAREACGKLKAAGEHERVLGISSHAARACPFDRWEQVSVEALAAMGRYGEAADLYAGANRAYFREQGIELKPWHEACGLDMSEWDWTGMDARSIRDQLDGTQGGQVVDYISFRDAYRILSDLSWRTGMSLNLMTCMARNRKENLLLPGPVLDRVELKLKNAIEKSVRASDVSVHCGGCKFLILLPDIVLEDCALVQKRICSEFYKNGRSMILEFDAVPVPGRKEAG